MAALAASQVVTDPVTGQGRRARFRGTVMVDGREAVEGEALVRMRDSQALEARAFIETETETDEVETVGRRGLRRMHSRRMGTRAMLAMLRANPEVELAEPNYVIRIANTPNDPSFGSLWGLLNIGQTISGSAGIAGADIGATDAWEITTGSRNNVVAVIDTGIDYNHPDLRANIWSAPAPFSVTIGGVTITCAAGTHGFNAINNTCNPMDDHNHGTHVSGTIGAVGNNGIGVAGVNWIASIMGAKFLSAAGFGTTSDAIKAIEFTIQAKAAFAGSGGANVRVLNNSWGGGGFSQALLDSINRANTNDMLFVAAAGNNASNNDTFPSYPAGYNAPNIVSVAATDNRDRLASFSNFGRNSVHLGAPGVGVLSTVVHGAGTCSTCHLASYNGTSMATPHVAGAAALVLSSCTQTTAQLKSTLLNSVDPVGALALTTSTGGRLNVNTALRTCLPAVTADSVAPNAGSGASRTFTLQYGDTIGASDLVIAGVWFHTTTASSANSCLAYYSQNNGRFNLVNDGGSGVTSGAPGGGGTLQNSSCSLALGSSSATTSGNTLTLQVALTFASAFQGAKNTYMYASNRTGLNTGWLTRGAWSVPDSRVAPVLTWAAPADLPYSTLLSGTQLNASADVPGAFTYFPAAGTWLNVGNGQVLTATFTPTDTAAYRPASRTVAINVVRATPTITWPAPPAMLAGTALDRVAQLNATASVPGTGSSLPGTFLYTPAEGTVLGIGNGQTLSLTFTPTDTAHYVAVTRTTLINVIPVPTVTAGTVTPSSGSGASQTFTLQYDNSSGASDLVIAGVWFNTTTAASANSCLVYYNRPTGHLNLATDAGTGVTSGLAGGSGTLQNSQCTLTLGSSSAAVSGTTLTLQVALTFKPAFAGAKNTYMYASNSFGTNTGWQARGSWTVPSGGGGGAGTSTADSVAPSSGSGSSRTFTLQYSASAGASDLVIAGVWFHTTTASAANSCLAYYTQPTGQFNLVNDAGTGVTSGAAGGGGTLQNSSCSLALASSTATPSGTTLTLQVALTFKPAFAGAKNSYMYASNSVGANSGWQARGTWTVPAPGSGAATADTVTPNSGTGASQTFILAYGASAGASDLVIAGLWFNTTTAVSANSCLVYYSQPTGTFNLVNDTGTGIISGLAGSAGTLQNSSCTVALSSLATPSGTTLTLQLAITFKPAFAGAKNSYMYASNTVGTNTGWQARGTWTVP